MELLKDMEKVLSVAKVDLLPMRRTSVLSLLSLRKLSESHDLIDIMMMSLITPRCLFTPVCPDVLTFS